ncbi:MAG: hypothetical protein AAF282_09180 [Cyanobacteria bacterium P01_A01_bin.15]
MASGVPDTELPSAAPLARELGRRALYLGYYVTGCKEMNYKARFRPCELLDPDGRWHAL